MTWIKMSDGFPEDPETLAVGEDAAWLHFLGIAYCSRNLTDGLIPHEMITKLTLKRNPNRLVARLLDAGWWRESEHGYHIIGYLKHQRSKAQVENERSRSRKRTAKHRAMSQESNGVTPPESRWLETESDTETDKNLTPSSLPAEDDTANEQPQNRSDGEKSPDPVATGFEKFWETYPKQPNGIKPDKRKAQAQWKKLKPDERDRAMTAVHHYRRDVDKRGSISKHAFRWLRDRTFEDWQAPAESTSEPTPPYLLPVSEQEVDPEGQARVEALIGGIHMGGAE